MATKEYELLFKLTAALGSNFSSTFQTAVNSANQLQSTMKALNTTAGKIDAYTKQQSAIEKNRVKIDELTKANEKLRSECGEDQKALEAIQPKIDANNTKISRLTESIGKQEQYLNRLGTELKEAGVNTDKLAQENERLTKTYKELGNAQAEVDRLTAAQEKNREAINKTRADLAKTVGVVAGMGAALYKGAVEPAIKFESAFVGMKKTVDGTEAELAEISNQFREMSKVIPASTTELFGVAEAAGQLGIKTDNIVDFTKVMVDLGQTTNLSATEAATELARFANVTGMSQKDFTKLGSVVVDLGNNFATTEADIVAMGTRLAGAGSLIGLSNSQIMGFSAALSSVGIEAEAGGSAFSKLMKRIKLSTELNTKDAKKDLADFGKVVGMTGAEFSTMFKKDAAGALNSFISGLSNMNEEGVSAIAVLDEMGFKEVRLSDTLLRAQNAHELFNDAIGMADTAWANNSALIDEANKRYVTTESQLATLKNTFGDIAISIGTVLLPPLNEAIGKIAEFTSGIATFAKENPEVVAKILKMGASLAGLAIGGQAVKLGYQEISGGILTVQTALAKFKLSHAQAAAEAMTGGAKISKLGKSLTGYFGGIKNALGGVDNAVSKFDFAKKLMGEFDAGSLGQVIQYGLSGVASNILSPFKAIGGLASGVTSKGLSKLSGILETFGKTKVGSFGKSVGGFFKSMGSSVGAWGKNVGGVFKSLGGTIGAVLKGPLGGLGSMFGGLFGKVMPIIAIISLLSAFLVKLSGGDISAFLEPLKAAFEQIQPVLQGVGEQFIKLGKDLLPMLADAAQKLMPLFGQLVSGLLPALMEVVKSIVPIVMELARTLLPAIIGVITELAPLLTDVITNVLPIITDILGALLPVITQLVKDILPIVVDVIGAILPLISQLIQAALPMLMSLLQALMPVITMLAEIFSSVLGGAISAIKPILDGLITILKGIIAFVTGVFTGNWSQAWEGIKNIFGGVFGSLVELVKAPFRIIISAVNGVIGGLNKLAIPDWVPGIGGKGINIPLIPTFATGSNYTPDTFIAGDPGPNAELVTNARGRKVFTAAQTSQIMQNINAAQRITQAIATPAPAVTVNTPASGAVSGGAQDVKLTVNYSPQITVNGNNPADLAGQLQNSENRVRQIFAEELRNFMEAQRRMKYA
ncbi:hypothetical protein FACS1894217_07160 [Clostridia bacterium]|nr:hypothetical protein FACS1894217_07160 [Clostridia bacterium]